MNAIDSIQDDRYKSIIDNIVFVDVRKIDEACVIHLRYNRNLVSKSGFCMTAVTELKTQIQQALVAAFGEEIGRASCRERVLNLV